VLVHDGVAVHAPATAQLLLTQHRQASYTTGLARQGRLVVDWELHLQRLVRCGALATRCICCLTVLQHRCRR
jgi:hypothetical protein